MRLLLPNGHFADLSVYKDTNDLAVFLDSLEIFGSGRVGAGGFGSVFGESLLLGFIPVLVESALDFVGKMGCPDSGERAEAAGSFYVADDSTHNHGGSLLSAK
jgi:hypothetical protein